MITIYDGKNTAVFEDNEEFLRSYRKDIEYFFKEEDAKAQAAKNAEVAKASKAEELKKKIEEAEKLHAEFVAEFNERSKTIGRLNKLQQENIKRRFEISDNLTEMRFALLRLR